MPLTDGGRLFSNTQRMSGADSAVQPGIEAGRDDAGQHAAGFRNCDASTVALNDIVGFQIGQVG